MANGTKFTRDQLEMEFSSLCRNAEVGTLSPLPSGFAVFPGFCDVHVHFREPGFSYKETVETGSLAAAHGGYTAVCTMPNLKPVPDSREHLGEVLAPIRARSLIDVRPYGSLTVNEAGEELSDLEAMAPDVIAFSDDGRGVQSESLMRSAMERRWAYVSMLACRCHSSSLE